MTIIDKTLVKKQFDGGLKTYHQEAVVQKRIAEELIDKLSLYPLPVEARLLEIGCGTGFLTNQVIEKMNFKEMWCNDIASSSRQRIEELIPNSKSPVRFLEGDAEAIDFPEPLDAIISCSTIQWFKDAERFFQKASECLKPGGLLAFSTFGKQNFKEISFLTGVGLEYKTLQQLKNILWKQFDVLEAEEWCEQMTFQQPLEVLRHIKQTGVNGIRNTKFGREALARFTDQYIRHFSVNPNQVSLTYHPMIVVAVKRNSRALDF